MGPSRRDGYLPLREYALVGDMRTAALVGRDGSVDWWCLPRFDAPAVLCRLMDARQGGHMRVGPTGAHGATRRYDGDSCVLVTDFETARGRVRLTDFMPVEQEGRAPQLLRLVEGLSGEVEVETVFRPTFDFARAPVHQEARERLAHAWGGGQALALRGPGRLGPGADGALTARTRVRAGARHWVTLTSGGAHAEAAPTDAEADAALAHTRAHWTRWIAAGDYGGPHAAWLRRSALTLKLLIHAPSGSFIAAPTTSLPESARGTRNWDYRYAWLRDSAWVMHVLMSLGYVDEAGAFLRWLESLGLDERPPEVLYRPDGSCPGEETCLTHLEGYQGAQPVRVGNGANGQLQLDVFGEVITAAYLFFETSPDGHEMRPGAWRMVRALATQAARRWHERDSGLWEQRCTPKHYVSSKLMCWVAVDRALKLSQRHGLNGGPLGEWAAARDALRELLETRGFDPEVGAFTHALGRKDLDASVLLMANHGFLPATDPRMRSTLARVREQLGEGPLVRRYVHPDGLPGEEGAFLLCGFWVVDSLALEGRLDEAFGLYEQLLGYSNDVGLMPEQVDPRTGCFLGNYPQGLTHLALIGSGLLLSRLSGHSSRCAMIDARCTQALPVLSALPV
ncbi:glycoside hydrolase family 15 protein [Melittangium boletus]|uniref:glycoside hydrolase family 15 protein n=1 Tax=Melittangium boletus TaxID=83453 RepID=UPI003DA2F936